MRRLLIAVSILFVSGAPVGAGSDARLVKVRELAALMEQEASFRIGVEAILGQQHEATMAQLDSAAVQSPDRKPAIEARKKELTELHERVLTLLWKHIDFDAFREDVVVPIYLSHFTDEEIDALLAFYRSPPGRKLVALTPELLRTSTEATARYFEPAFERVRQELMGDVDQKRLVLWTVAEMRKIATAIDALRVEVKFDLIDADRVPRVASVDELRPLFEAADVRGTLESNDAWGEPFVILISEGARRYRIVSAGADRTFESNSRVIPSGAAPADAATLWTPTNEADIIWADDRFVQAPRQSGITP